jgi:uncharacterized membrane protein
MRAMILLAALGLIGCHPQAPDGAPAKPPADAPQAGGPQAGGPQGEASTSEPARAIGITDFSGPMIARGNEPFWAVKMEGKTFTLQRPDHPDVVFEAPGAQIKPGRGVWSAKAADGQTLTVTLYVSDCSDGMSDLNYPFVAEVEFAGETLRGCAAKVADLPKPGAGG